MNTISLQQMLPCVFAGQDSIRSEVWHRNLEFRKGESYLIEAASGTGKSSLCSFIYGYRNDYQGILCFDGENVRKLSVSQWIHIRQKSLSMLYQDLRLFTELSALENIQLKNRLTGYKTKKEIAAFFQALGIEDKMKVKVGHMSFGQQQRVALIRTLCQPFDFIFLDEPISHLDQNNSRKMCTLLMQEVTRQGAGLVVTSIGKHMELNYDKVLKL